MTTTDAPEPLSASDHVRKAQEWLRAGDDLDEDGPSRPTCAAMASAHAATAQALLAAQFKDAWPPS